MKKFFLRVFIGLIILVLLGFGFRELVNARHFQFYGGIVTDVKTKEKVVALTFDDGPTEKTDEILKVLDDANVKATFFLTGREIDENMEAARKIVDAGHEIGNHTYSHERMIFKSLDTVKSEIERTDALIREAGYEGTIQFRPPNGKKFLTLPYYLDKHNRKTILWNIEPDSYPEIASDSNKIVEHVTENVEPGSIILLHVMYESRKESAESVEGIIKNLKEEGYSFKTVSELLGDEIK